MKSFILFFFLLGICATQSLQAQFKLKTLDNVIVSMKDGETMANYSRYLSSYFTRFDILESVSETKVFSLNNNKSNSKTYLHGKGVNPDGKTVVFRTEVKVSDDGLTITKVSESFDVETCISSNCTACTFTDEGGCTCAGEGSCDHNISIKK